MTGSRSLTAQISPFSSREKNDPRKSRNGACDSTVWQALPYCGDPARCRFRRRPCRASSRRTSFPQLSTLLDQLQWLTLAGKPENDRLRVVAEGECTAEATARQLADVLNGVVILAEGGLNDARTRQQLDPALREAYLELLKSADVSKIDRGDSKSVRLVFDITPPFWRPHTKPHRLFRTPPKTDRS